MRFQASESQWLTICFLFLTFTTSQGGCPWPCSCYYYGRTYVTNCARRGLTRLPNGVFDNRTRYLALNSNRLTAVPAGSFDYNDQLVILYLHMNKLKSLPRGIFSNNKLLATLYLHNNQLSSLPTGVFDNNKQLYTLILKANNLISLPAGIFDNNYKLNTLELSMNRLTSLSFGIFNHNTQLTQLSLSRNQITSLPHGVFEKNEKLILLDLSINQLTSLPVGVFNNNKRLIQINLRDNRLISLPAGVFDHNYRLIVLILSMNRLTSLSFGIFDNNTQLTQLSLSENHLTSLSAGVFDKNEKLSILILGNNQLTSLPVGVFSNNRQLTQLSVGENNLTSLPAGVFDNNTYLTVLILQVNQLTALPEGLFDNNARLAKLSLLNNSLMMLPAGLFHNNPQLVTILLNGNQLTSLPDGIFENNIKLDIIDLKHNQLTSLPAGIFDNNKQLRVLYISQNNLTSLAAGIFDNNEQLKYLYLEDNEIMSVPAGIFTNLKQLIYLFFFKNQLSSIPAPCFAMNTQLEVIFVHKNQLTSLPPGVFENNKKVKRLSLDGNKLTTLPVGIFHNNTDIVYLNLSNNELTSLPIGIFKNNRQLQNVDLQSNKLTSLPVGIFDSNENLEMIRLGYNPLTSLPAGIFDNNIKLEELILRDSPLTSLRTGIFRNNSQLRELFLERLQLKELPSGIFDNNKQLDTLSIKFNQISQLHVDTFKHLTKLTSLFLNFNRFTKIPRGLLRNNKKLLLLALADNLLEDLPEDLLRGIRIRMLAIVGNRLKRLPDGFFTEDAEDLETLNVGRNILSTIDFKHIIKLNYLIINQNHFNTKSLTTEFRNLTSLKAFLASYNEIEEIPDDTFLGSKRLQHILLNNNKLRRITSRTFYGAFRLVVLFLSDNPIEIIEDRAFFYNTVLLRLYLLQTNIKSLNIQWVDPVNYADILAIQIQTYPSPSKQDVIYLPDIPMLHEGFAHSGFKCQSLTLFGASFIACVPCFVGTYVIFKFTVNAVLCMKCPAGGFYEDSLAYYGERAYGNGCKMCDNGTFVHIKNAPGTKEDDCKPCPEGTKNKDFSGFRACPCQDRFYRLDRFERCYSCPDYGVTCFNESMTLKPGYYWQWISQSDKEHYINFTNNLQIFDNSYNKDLVTFKGSFPKYYQCPRSQSCLGGLDANCAEGYTGPLCAICDERHYNLVATCFKCPTLGWLIFQISSIFLVVVVIIFLLIKGQRHNKQDKRSLADILLARLKIIVSFYQIFSSTLNGFSYVQWPSAMTKISEYAKFVQLNVIQIAPLHCFNSRLKMDAYDHLVFTCSISAAVILLALAYYNFKRLYLKSKAKWCSQSDTHSCLEATKEACYRNVFLFIFVTYPQTCSTIFQMLPAACHRICQDSSQTQCTFYLKADYTITCFTDKYNRYVILAYAALVYPFAVPLLTIAVLWKYYYKRNLLKKKEKASYKEIRQGAQSYNQSVNQNSSSNQSRSASNPGADVTSRKHPENPENILELDSGDSKARNVAPFSLLKVIKTFSSTKVENKAKKTSRCGTGESLESNDIDMTTLPIVAGMSFIYENYSENCWFWETLEMTRKLLLTSTLAVIGAEGRTSLGVASMLSGCYAILHAHFKPIPDKFEHVLQLTSLLVTFANTCIGMMLKIDQGALLDADAKFMDSWIMTALLVTANVMVTAIVVVKYTVVVGQSLYSIFKNPRCSLACCLSVILTLDEVQSEARSMESSSGWEMKTQLQSGNEIEGLSMEDAAGDYGLTGIDIGDDDNNGECMHKSKKGDKDDDDDDNEWQKGND